MADAVSDTGPILHLHEIDCLDALAVGTIGILLRRFHLRRSSFQDLELAVERLMTRSTLYMSAPFRQYIRERLRRLAEP